MKTFISALALGLVVAFSAPAFAGAGREAFVGCQITGCPAATTKTAENKKMSRHARKEARQARRHGAS
jgi:hypothetical protein